MRLRFEYDPEKSQQNLDKHGLDFEKAQELWRTRHLLVKAKTVGSEERQAILGTLDGEVYIAIFVMRSSTIRVISCHRADRTLQERYERILNEEKKSKAH